MRQDTRQQIGINKLAYTGLLAGILTYGGRLQRGSPGAFELAWADCKHDKTLN